MISYKCEWCDFIHNIMYIWYYGFWTLILYFQHTISYKYDLIGLQLWYHLHYIIYDIWHPKVWYQMWWYEIVFDIKHICAYPKDQHKDSPVTFHAWTGGWNNRIILIVARLFRKMLQYRSKSVYYVPTDQPIYSDRYCIIATVHRMCDRHPQFSK